MKKIDPYLEKSKKSSICLEVIFAIVFAAVLVGVCYFTIGLIFGLSYQEKPYHVHHPALYSVQENYFQLDNRVYYMADGYCLAFDDQKKTSSINIKHSSYDYCVSNDILYTYIDKHIYSYNSSFEEMNEYDIGSASNFFVRDNYIYLRDYNHEKKEVEFYKYSMLTCTKELLDWNGKYPALFITDGIYFEETFHQLEDNVNYQDWAYSREFYNENYEMIKMEKDNCNLLINDKSFNLGYTFWIEERIYFNSECVYFSTYKVNHEDCIKFIEPCISQLNDVKLWKYDIKAEQLSLIKQFNDYTILISFDDNNYHYYFDGKLYSNDIEVEDAPKIEVGDIFTYYATQEPYVFPKETWESYTHFAYFSGEFYIIHEEINSDLEEFHGR